MRRDLYTVFVCVSLAQLNIVSFYCNHLRKIFSLPVIKCCEIWKWRQLYVSVCVHTCSCGCAWACTHVFVYMSFTCHKSMPWDSEWRMCRTILDDACACAHKQRECALRLEEKESKSSARFLFLGETLSITSHHISEWKVISYHLWSTLI